MGLAQAEENGLALQGFARTLFVRVLRSAQDDILVGAVVPTLSLCERMGHPFSCFSLNQEAALLCKASHELCSCGSFDFAQDDTGWDGFLLSHPFALRKDGAPVFRARPRNRRSLGFARDDNL